MKQFDLQILIGKELMNQNRKFAMTADYDSFSAVIEHIENRFTGDLVVFMVELPMYVNEALVWWNNHA